MRPNKIKHYCFPTNPMVSRDLVDTISSDINSPLIRLSSPFGANLNFFRNLGSKKKFGFEVSISNQLKFCADRGSLIKNPDKC